MWSNVIAYTRYRAISTVWNKIQHTVIQINWCQWRDPCGKWVTNWKLWTKQLTLFFKTSGNKCSLKESPRWCVTGKCHCKGDLKSGPLALESIRNGFFILKYTDLQICLFKQSKTDQHDHEEVELHVLECISWADTGQAGSSSYCRVPPVHMILRPWSYQKVLLNWNL